MTPEGWIVDQEIGRGAQGVVYLARQGEGPVAALKVFEPHARAAWAREVRALTRVSHPCLPRLLGSLDHPLHPWIALEYLPGTPLRSWWQQVWQPWGPSPSALDGPTLRRLLTPLARLCEPLARLHAQGFLHLDLGPHNVLVREEEAPVLLDLGLSRPFVGATGREVMELTTPGEGAATWVAPEQLRGETLDGRTDLYALGSLLYVALSGAAPFRTLSAKLAPDASPAPLSERVSGVPERLERLILALLSTSPAARPGYAEDVAAVLCELCGEPSPPPGAAPRPLLRPPLCGHEDALARASRALERRREGGPQVVALVGESGAGKTRLALEMAQQARRRGARLWVGECSPGSSPLRPLAEVMEALVSSGHRGEGLGWALLGRLWPGLGGGEAAEVDLPAELVQAQVARAVGEGLKRLDPQGEGLILVDDAHWAEPFTLAVLERLSAQPGGAGPAVLITCRSEERPAALSRWLPGPGATEVRVGRLAPHEVASLVGGMLAAPPPGGELLGELTTRSEGNAFFVTEYVRTAIALGRLIRQPGGRVEVAPGGLLPLPTSVAALIHRRLELLSPAARQLAECAAVLGREPERPLLEGLLPRREDLGEALDELLLREVLEERDGRLRFVHDRVREATWEVQDPALRAGRHRAAALLMERLPAPESVSWWATRAHHHEQGGEGPAAWRLYRQGAELASRTFQRAEVPRLLEGALRCVGPGGERAALLLLKAQELLYFESRYEEALAQIAELEKLAYHVQEEPIEAEASLLKARVLRQLGRLPEARREGEGALARMEGLGMTAALTSAQVVMASVLFDCGDYDGAERLAREALASLADGRDPRREAAALGTLAGVADARGDLSGARQLCLRALERHRHGGNRLGEARELGNLALVLESEGSLEQALGQLGEAERILAEIGYAKELSIVALSRARIQGELGLNPQAITSAEEALALARAAGNQRREELATLLLERLRGQAPGA